MNQTKNNITVQKLVIMAVMLAIVIVLQALGGMIAIPGTGLSISLTLIPIVLGAILYGPAFGSVLGLAFGAVVAISVLRGTAGVFSADMFMHRPNLTIFICLFKGFAAGLVPGLIAMGLKKKHLYLATLLAALSAPVMNTGIFCLGLANYYGDVVDKYAGDATALYFIVFMIVGVNFLIELGTNLVFAPALVRIIQALNKSGVVKSNTVGL